MVMNHGDGRVPALFNLTCASLFIVVALFVFSMLHLGSDSFFTVPAVAGLTLIYHYVILTLEYRAPRRPAPKYSASSAKSSIICGSILIALWMGAFAITLLMAILISFKDIKSTQGSMGQVLWVMIVQCVLIPVEALVLVVIVVRSTFERKYGGGGNWRQITDGPPLTPLTEPRSHLSMS